jgi:hypothetical protein
VFLEAKVQNLEGENNTAKVRDDAFCFAASCHKRVGIARR